MNEQELRALLLEVQQGQRSPDSALACLRTAFGPTAATAANKANKATAANKAVLEREPQSRASGQGTDGAEFARIRELAALFAAEHPEVATGIGDDAAVLRVQHEPLVLSVDVAVEGVHFERALLSCQELGARALSAAVSDLAAMGARPLAALCSLIAPRSLAAAEFSALHAGIAQAARSYGCAVIGGNLSSGGQLSLTTTVIGSLPGPGLYRAGARSGDEVYVTGTLGSAALGLELLQRAAADRGPAFVQAWRAPRACIAQGLALSGKASAAIDVSDGALADLGHICDASGLGAVVEAQRVPLAPGMSELARSLGLDPLALALAGGEDYQLIYTLTPGILDPCGGTRIGRMQPGRTVQVVDAGGAPLNLRTHGFQHF